MNPDLSRPEAHVDSMLSDGLMKQNIRTDKMRLKLLWKRIELNGFFVYFVGMLVFVDDLLVFVRCLKII